MRHIVMLHALIVAGLVPEKAPPPSCGWANQLMPSLNSVVSNLEGLALSLGGLIWLIALAALIVLAATKHSKVLVITLVSVFAFSLLLRTGFNPIGTVC